MSGTVAGTDGQCCDCGELIGCSCGGVACTLVCQKKEYDATLCGFAEFVASLPPNYYLSRAISGTMTVKKYITSDCSGLPRSGSQSAVKITNCGSPLVTVTASVVSEDATHVTYHLTASGGPLSTRLDTSFAGSFGTGSSFAEATVTVAKSTAVLTITGSVYCAINGGYVGAPPFYFQSEGFATTVDVWSVDDEYDSTCTLTQDDGTARTADGVSADPPTSLDSAYAGAAIDLTSTVKTVTGDGICLNVDVGVYIHTDGTVTETLTSPDSEDAAEARATSGIDWDTGGPCNDRTAFRSTRTARDFSGRKARVKIQWTAVIGTDYEATVRFARRVLGSSGPFLFYTTASQSITADSTSEETDWIDVPNDSGWETIAANCTVVAT